MSDRILLTGLTFFAYHGVHEEERRLGQRFGVDVGVELDLRHAGSTDDLNATVSYSDVFAIVRGVVEGRPRNLIEAVAEDVATAVLAIDAVEAVTVRLTKPWAPIRGMTEGAVAVEIRRERPH